MSQCITEPRAHSCSEIFVFCRVAAEDYLPMIFLRELIEVIVWSNFQPQFFLEFIGRSVSGISNH